MSNKSELNNKVIKEMADAAKANQHSISFINKASVSVGLGQYKENKGLVEAIEGELSAVTGQKPKVTRAKKSISGFKIREGQQIGFVVTLRGKRMWDFINKTISAVLPRVRDFDGISNKSIDSSGNMTFAIKEHTVFPEIKADESKAAWGMAITLTLNKKTDKKTAEAYYKKIGFIFKGGNNG